MLVVHVQHEPLVRSNADPAENVWLVVQVDDVEIPCCGRRPTPVGPNVVDLTENPQRVDATAMLLPSLEGAFHRRLWNTYVSDAGDPWDARGTRYDGDLPPFIRQRTDHLVNPVLNGPASHGRNRKQFWDDDCD